MTAQSPPSDFDPWRVVEAVIALLVAAYGYIFKGVIARMDKLEREMKERDVAVEERIADGIQERHKENQKAIDLLREDVRYIRNRLDQFWPRGGGGGLP